MGLTGQTIWNEMAEETREEAERLLDSFGKAVDKDGVRHRDIKKEGVSDDLIIEEMNNPDLVILGAHSVSAI